MKHGCIIIFLLAALVAAIAIPAPVFAEDAGSATRELNYNLTRDLVITGATGAAFLGLTLFENKLAPANCRWCQVDSFDAWGHNNLKWSNTGSANTASSVTAYFVAPLAAFGSDAFAAHDADSLNKFPIDALIIAEATTSAALFTQAMKLITGRERPSAHYAAGTSTSPDDNTSFFSAHTSIAFALAASSGMVATMRGYRLAPLIWGTGMAVAVTTGYLRVAADKHYLTDVITGAAIGSAFGIGLPYLLHRPTKANEILSSISAVPTDGGLFVSYRKLL